MSAIFPFSEEFYIHVDRGAFSRDEIEDFIREYSFSDEKLEVYQKSKKIADIVDTIGNISLLITVVSLVTIIIYPLYSIGAGLLFDIINLPAFVDRFIAERPSVQASTLIFIAATLFVSLFVFLLAFRISSTFENYADKTGIDSDSIEFRKIAESYLAFEDGDYTYAINKLDEYESYYGRRFISQYVDSARSQGRVDTDYVDETFEEFLGLFIEYTHSPSTDKRAMMMGAITNRKSDYRINKEPELEEESEEEFKDTYIGIISAIFAGLISSIPRQVYSLTIEKPIVVHIGLLLIGVGLINVNATLAIVVVTVLIAGFDAWKRNRTTDDRESRPSD